MLGDSFAHNRAKESPVVTKVPSPRLVRSETSVMRIAIIAPPWVPVPPPAYGGTELVLDLLARGLRETGQDVVLFTTADSTCPVPREFIHEHTLGTTAGSVGELRHVLHAYETAAFGFDIVHDHTLAGPIYSARFPDLRVVTTNHGPFDEDLRDIYRAMTPRVRLIAISYAQAASANGIPIARVIHHGIDVQAMPFGRGDGDYLLFLGRMSPEKGAHRAARIARAAGVPLRIAAKMREPAERAYFEEHVRPLLGDAVEYVGEVGADDKKHLLAGARPAHADHLGRALRSCHGRSARLRHAGPRVSSRRGTRDHRAWPHRIPLS